MNPLPAVRMWLGALALAGGALLPGLVAQTAPSAEPTAARPGASDPRTPTPAAVRAAATSADPVVQLNPFEVDASQDRGYYAENTLAGSRMNTNLSDLGAAISVVTRQQMEDTASIDLNDVFRYEINTEGSETYTPPVQQGRGDGVVDVIAGATQGASVTSLTNANANRVRGLGAPSSALNYYPSLSAIPVDAYNVGALEISRGPNSMLFGIGSPAGVVNTSTSQAVLNRNSNRIDLRGDDRGSYRGSVSFNRSLLQDRAAIYIASVYDDREFTRKPSFDITRRVYGALTLKPFKKTVVKLNAESYNNYNHRPNTISPVDGITQWNLAGRPSYDPVTKTVTYLANSSPAYASWAGTHKAGDVVGPYIASASSPFAQSVRDYLVSLPSFNPALRGGAGTTNSTFTTYGGVSIFGQNPVTTQLLSDGSANPLFVPGFTELSQARSVMMIQNGQVQNWFQPLYTQTYLPGWGTAANPAANPSAIPSSPYSSNVTADIYNRDSFAAKPWTNYANVTKLGGYHYPGVTDRSIYDWRKINILQADFGKTRNATYEADVEQEITQDLFLNAGWMRQDFDQFSNYTIGQLNATVLVIDPNKNLPDGTPNPYFGKPYVTDIDPDRYVNAEIDDHFRAMLAYTPDFRHKRGWLSFLGHHQLLALWSRDESVSAAYRQRLNYVAAGSQDAAYRYLPNPNNDASNNPTGWNFQAKGSLQRLFYLANPGDPSGVVTRSSGEWNAITYSGNIRTYDYNNLQFQNSPVTTTFNNFDFPTRSERVLQTISGGMTNYLLGDRLITTFGYRQDKFKARTNTNGAYTLADGTVVPALTNPQKFQDGYLNTDAIWNRFGPWQYITGRTKTGGGVVRPFRGWGAFDDRPESGSGIRQFVRSLGFSYNWSDNFDIPSSAQTDAFGNALPKPKGVGRDLGLQFALDDNKLFARIDWFQATNLNQRVSPGATMGRLTSNIDTTLFRNWARTISIINLGQDPTSASFGTLSADQENQVQAAAAKIWQLPYDYYTNLPNIGVTGDSKSKGLEASLNYNTGGWRNRLTFSKQETINTSILAQYDAWLAVRLPIFLNAKASDYLLPQYQKFATYNTSSGTAVNLTNFWTSSGYNSVVLATNPIDSNVVNYYNDILTPQVQLQRDLLGQSAGNQRKYHWTYNTGYDFTHGRLAGFSLGGAERWESPAVIGYYGKQAHTQPAIPDLIDSADATKPIYDQANSYTDFYVRYKMKVWRNRATLTFQLNVVNAFENGHLQTVAVNYDGSPYGYRIVDPRQFIYSTSLDF